MTRTFTSACFAVTVISVVACGDANDDASTTSAGAGGGSTGSGEAGGGPTPEACDDPIGQWSATELTFATASCLDDALPGMGLVGLPDTVGLTVDALGLCALGLSQEGNDRGCASFVSYPGDDTLSFPDGDGTATVTGDACSLTAQFTTVCISQYRASAEYDACEAGCDGLHELQSIEWFECRAACRDDTLFTCRITANWTTDGFGGLVGSGTLTVDELGCSDDYTIGRGQIDR